MLKLDKLITLWMWLFPLQLTDLAVKDYNRARAYLADLANRDGIPVFDKIEESVQCAVTRLKDTASWLVEGSQNVPSWLVHSKFEEEKKDFCIFCLWMNITMEQSSGLRGWYRDVFVWVCECVWFHLREPAFMLSRMSRTKVAVNTCPC